MRFVASAFTLLFIFTIECKLGVTQWAADSPTIQSIGISSEQDQISEPFFSILQNRHAKPTSSIIKVIPEVTKLRPREIKFINRKTIVLSIPVSITNYSSQKLTMNLSHEPGGGLWPPSDLYVAIHSSISLQGSPAKGSGSSTILIAPPNKPNKAKKLIWSEAPGYQVRNKDSGDSLVVFYPNDTRIFDIRLNWRGTGSIPATPLISEVRPGKYKIKFLLIFKVDGSEEYVESQGVDIVVQSRH